MPPPPIAKEANKSASVYLCPEKSLILPLLEELEKEEHFLMDLCKNVCSLQLAAAFLPRGGPMSELLNRYSYVNILFNSNLVIMNILAKHFALIFLSPSSDK